VSETTDAIARLLALAANFDPDSDECFFIRQIVRVWRSNYYKLKPSAKELSEKQFLKTFDIDFELRRLNRVAFKLDEELQKSEKSARDRECLRKARLIAEQALQYMRLQLRNIRTELPLDELKRLKEAIPLDEFRLLMTQAELPKRHKAAQDLYHKHEGDFCNVGQKLIESFSSLRDEFDNKHGSVAEHIRQLSDIAGEAYDEFEQWDEIALPLLAGTGVREFTRADVYCIGPAEGEAAFEQAGDSVGGAKPFRPFWLGTDIKKRPLNAKLKGTAFMDFGAFMSPEWRRNDLMWGRLDAAEKLVRILLPLERDTNGRPHPESVALQEKYAGRLREAILEEELDGNYYIQWARDRLGNTAKDGNSDAAEKIANLVSSIPFLKKVIAGEGEHPRSNFIMNYYDEPQHPQPKDYSNWIGRSLTILGWMIEDLRIGAAGRPALWLRTLGTTTVHAVRFSMPNTFQQMIVRGWAWLFVAAGIALGLVGAVFSPLLAWWGLGIAAVGLLVVAVQNAVSARLAGSVGVPWRMRMVAPALGAVLGMVVVGLVVFGGVSVSRCLSGASPQEGVASGKLDWSLTFGRNLRACLQGELQSASQLAKGR
jgi:hypothetical protein